jgi:hypothetical protein
LIDSGNSDRSVPVFTSLWRQPARRNVVPARLAQGEPTSGVFDRGAHFVFYPVVYRWLLGRSAGGIGML